MQRRRKPRTGPPSQEEIDAHYRRQIEIKELEEKLGIDFSPPNKSIDVEEEEDLSECNFPECKNLIEYEHSCPSCGEAYCLNHLQTCYDCQQKFCQACLEAEFDGEFGLCGECTFDYQTSEHHDEVE